MTTQPAVIREELAKIVASPPFAKGEKLSRFLRFIVEETLAGRAERLKEYTIGVEVYERRRDYDSRLDATVRVEAGRLRSKLMEYYSAPGSGERLRIALPKGSYVPQFLEVAAVPQPAMGRRAWVGAIAGGGLGAFLLVGKRPAGMAVVVAPIVALDGDTAAAGRLEANLRKRMAGQSGFELRQGAKREIRDTADLLAYGKDAGANAVLTGSLRQGRAAMALIGIRDSYKIWSRTFETADAGKIVAALTERERRRTGPGSTNEEAVKLYLEGHRILQSAPPRKRVPREWPQHRLESLRLFERAAELDPQFSAAWAGMAENYDAIADWDIARRAELTEKAARAGRRALEADEENGTAHRIMGKMTMFRRWDLPEATERLSRAVELDPRDAQTQRMYGAALSLRGRFDEAVREISRAEVSAPDVSAISTALAEVYFLARRYGEGLKQCDRALALDGSNSFAQWLGGVCAQMNGDWVRAEAAYRACLRKYDLDSRAVAGLAYLRARQGRGGEALRMVEEAIAKWGTREGWHCIDAMVSAAAGDMVRAGRALRRGIDFNEGSVLYVLSDPRFDGLRETAEYRELAGRVKR